MTSPPERYRDDMFSTVSSSRRPPTNRLPEQGSLVPNPMAHAPFRSLFNVILKNFNSKAG
ncbi:hypothetical protein M413DRAFT_444278 [Hebeloma cylindrosporum]|uniref:Uncharacterized protein n=1 Tax=Hebeloma cylindrosporum TaxID=76867 RepID=A0A0C2XY42_HEBCY|nr:hypothetical protein M413DRAFT_444278 [Hebeloma cylindrosporum h7]